MAATAVSFGEGDYISDGKRLLRVIEWAVQDGEAAHALVEDCRTNSTAHEVLNPHMWMRIEPAKEDEGG